MKKTTLSLVTSAVLMSGLLVGCGGGSGSSTASKSVQVVDGYVIKLTQPAVATCGSNTYTTNTLGAKGAITFNGAVDSTCTITVTNPIIDSNNNGDYDPATDKQTTYTFKASGDSTYVSHLTTLVEAQKEAAGNDQTKLAEVAKLAALVKDYDPVQAANTIASATSDAAKNQVKKLVVLGEIAKTVLDANASQAVNIDFADVVDTTKDDVNITAATNSISGALKTVATTKATTIKTVVDIIEKVDSSKVDPDKLNTLLVEVSDGGKELSVAQSNQGVDLTSSTKSGETISSGDISSVDTAIGNGNSAVDSLPAKILVGTKMTLGSKELTLVGNTFTTEVATNSKISDFYNIALTGIELSKAYTIPDNITANLKVTITDAGTLASKGDSVSLQLNGVKIENESVNSKKVKFTIPSGSTIVAANNGVASITAIADGSTVSANTSGDDIVNTDLVFNVNTILNRLNADGNAIKTALTQLEAKLAVANKYTVKLEVLNLDESKLPSNFTSIMGTVTVK